jgi:methionine--tRNA ligase beta chain
MISFEDFKKMELKAGKILAAERVDGSEKLIKLMVDIGFEQRQILAGIGKFYEPENLIGKTVVVAVNLETRTMMGMESNGMLLAADAGESGPVLLVPEKKDIILPGAEIR